MKHSTGHFQSRKWVLWTFLEKKRNRYKRNQPHTYIHYTPRFFMGPLFIINHTVNIFLGRRKITVMCCDIFRMVANISETQKSVQNINCIQTCASLSRQLAYEIPEVLNTSSSIFTYYSYCYFDFKKIGLFNPCVVITPISLLIGKIKLIYSTIRTWNTAPIFEFRQLSSSLILKDSEHSQATTSPL